MQPVPLDTVRADRWRHLELRGTDAVAWVGDGAMVARRGGLVLAQPPPSEPLLGPTAALLSAIRHDLPPTLELRAGGAMGGILAGTHRVELLGPQQRLRAGPPHLPDPERLVALRPGDGPRIQALADRDAAFTPAWLHTGPWFGVVRDDRLVAACGPSTVSPAGHLLAAPILSRKHRKADLAARLLAALARRLPGDVALDIRADRRDRVTHAVQAGFVPVFRWERWRATRPS